ncbi:polyhydroxyalkanoate synthesis regulator DNA-binding domain-containing protein [Bradyrhizobium sp. CB3481]|uniref:polyhydroxyalkanoate synthesis regulator DNA-binding domain-containing protein n=1 Tax=Bradyrhizobium sp. CB3481 TaxID=3039158 RepID=UPI0024B2171C|nr:polyhydroxyalkanoate synthesis regulator DNA-binding domain-containing protein [Bradyrhizobium sp. CB3481]WFU14036.1 polyhydroxyalkanoate synthesis regulator DNA-binding domain-containing protein [Bradyrhizobium sp. CB3481]
MAKLIQRHAQSRLYDTQAACYVPIMDLREWRSRGLAFTVVDAETNQNIAASMLA